MAPLDRMNSYGNGPKTMPMWRWTLMATAWLISFTALQHPSYQHSSIGTLTVTIDGLESDRGSVRIALSNSEENYYDYPNPTLGVSAPIRKGIATWRFHNLPFGTYAIKAFHDENGDGELDTNFLGIPVESYGFSTNSSGLFGPPSWEAARFLFEADSLTVWISLG